MQLQQPEIKRAVIYTRVSSVEQVENGGSLDTQERICKAYAKDNGITVKELFTEKGESAKTANRTELKKMIDYCTKHQKEVDAVIIYKVDRLARDVGDYFSIMKTLNSKGIVILSVTERTDNTPAGRFQTAILSASAQFDNEMRAERCRNGLIDAVKKGRWVWKAPIGYINTRCGKNSNIVPDQRGHCAEIVGLAWRLILNGYKVEQARAIVNLKMAENGLKQIPKQTFSSMLKKKIYTGVIECKSFGVSIKSDDIIPLVDEDTFYKVQRILAGNPLFERKYVKYSMDYPLRGLVCDKCGHRLYGGPSRGNGGVYHHYICKRPECKGKHICYSADRLNQEFCDYVANMSLRLDISEALRQAIKLNFDSTTDMMAKRKAQLRHRLQEIETEVANVVKKNAQGIITDSQLGMVLKGYEDEEARIHAELADIRSVPDDASEILEFGIGVLQDLKGAIMSIKDPEVRFKFQQWLFPSGVTYDGEKFQTTHTASILQIKNIAQAGDIEELSCVVE